MRAISSDPGVQARLREDGYAVVSLLEESQLKAVRQLPGTPRGDRDAIRAVLAPLLDSVLDRYRVPAARLAPAAEPGAPMRPGTLSLDGDGQVALGVWCPLDGTATFAVVPGSHRNLRVTRGVPDLPSVADLDRLLDGMDGVDAEKVEVEPGEAILFDQRLLHAAPADRGVDVLAAPREATLVVHRHHGDGSVERFVVEDEYFLAAGDAPPSGSAASRGLVLKETAFVTLPSPSPSTEPDRGPPSFQDPDLEAAFRRDGFVRVQMLTPDEVERLQQVGAGGAGEEFVAGFYSSILQTSQPFRESDIALREIFDPVIARWFLDHRSVAAGYQVKSPGDEGLLWAHQDWTLVDERSYSSLTIWCPLQDVDETNGTLRVIPGSHRWPAHLWRGTPVDTFPYSLGPFGDRLIMEHGVAFPVRMGEVIVFHHRLFHGSAPNQSDRVRVAAGVVAVPAEATTIHVRLEGDRLASVYTIDGVADLHDLGTGSVPPTSRMVGRVLLPPEYLTEGDVDRLLAPRRGLSLDEPMASRPRSARRRAWDALPLGVKWRVHEAWSRLPESVRARTDPRRSQARP